jgi:hypothetical protein
MGVLPNVYDPEVCIETVLPFFYSIITMHFSQLLLSHQLNALFILKNTIWFLKIFW